MPRNIDRDQVQDLRARGAQLVEVLPEAEYEERHIPGALSLPLQRIDTEASDRLQPEHAVIVYCWDSA